MEKTCYALRLSARIIDLLLVILVVLLFEKGIKGIYVNPLAAYLLYGIIVAFLDGKSLGKYLFSLTVRTDRTGFWHLFARAIREPLLLLLSPIIFLNLIVVSPLPLHDRITGTKVVRDDN